MSDESYSFRSYQDTIDLTDDAFFSSFRREVIEPNFRTDKSREEAVKGAKRITDLFIEPLMESVFYHVPMPEGSDYRTREELVRTSGNERIMRVMHNQGLLRLHSRWPVSQVNHSQALYKLVASKFAELREKSFTFVGTVPICPVLAAPESRR